MHQERRERGSRFNPWRINSRAPLGRREFLWDGTQGIGAAPQPVGYALMTHWAIWSICRQESGVPNAFSRQGAKPPRKNSAPDRDFSGPVSGSGCLQMDSRLPPTWRLEWALKLATLRVSLQRDAPPLLPRLLAAHPGADGGVPMWNWDPCQIRVRGRRQRDAPGAARARLTI